MLKSAREQDLLDEIKAAERDIERGQLRRDAAQKALDTLKTTGEKYVGEREDERERLEKLQLQARTSVVATT